MNNVAIVVNILAAALVITLCVVHLREHGSRKKDDDEDDT